MRPAAEHTRALGQRAEALVAQALAERGFILLGRNVRIGRLELDLIARRGSLLVFCEVRSRTNAQFVDPVETISPRKAARIRSAAARWLAEAGLGTLDVRFDAASVIFDREPPRIEYYEDAF